MRFMASIFTSHCSRAIAAARSELGGGPEEAVREIGDGPAAGLVKLGAPGLWRRNGCWDCLGEIVGQHNAEAPALPTQPASYHRGLHSADRTFSYSPLHMVCSQGTTSRPRTQACCLPASPTSCSFCQGCRVQARGSKDSLLGAILALRA
jgi:hypothetical protein